MDRFPQTRQIGLDELMVSYAKPVYKCLRIQLRKSEQEAAQLANGFFAWLAEDGALEALDGQRQPIRAHLEDRLMRHAAAARKASGEVALDYGEAERELSLSQDASDVFTREWRREMFALGVADLRRWSHFSGRSLAFTLFEEHDLTERARPSAAELAGRHGVPVTKVTEDLTWARHEFRRLVLDRLAGITSGEAEWHSEGRVLLGSEST
jgi:hypothetical protein